MKTHILSFSLALCLTGSLFAQAPHAGIDPKSANKSASTTTSTRVEGDCEVSYLDYVFMAGKVLQRTLEDMFPISEADEMKYGNQMHDEIATQYSFIGSSDKRFARIQKIFSKLLPFRERKEISYKIYLINDDVINAFSHAGGHVYVTTGILADLKSDDELALVLGHEISHVDKKHCIRHVQAQMGMQAAGEYAGIASQVTNIVSLPFGQYDEYESDWAGASIMSAAGYSPSKGLEVFRRWSANENSGDVMEKVFRTHPFSAERVCYLQMYVDNMGK